MICDLSAYPFIVILEEKWKGSVLTRNHPRSCGALSSVGESLADICYFYTRNRNKEGQRKRNGEWRGQGIKKDQRKRGRGIKERDNQVEVPGGKVIDEGVKDEVYNGCLCVCVCVLIGDNLSVKFFTLFACWRPRISYSFHSCLLSRPTLSSRDLLLCSTEPRQLTHSADAIPLRSSLNAPVQSVDHTSPETPRATLLAFSYNRTRIPLF